MKISRRELLVAGAGVAGSVALAGCQQERSATGESGGSGNEVVESAGGAAIDRRAVVRRHNPAVHAINPYAALTVGNGMFAFTADVTGLQTFLEPYHQNFPLCTCAYWAWHTTPAGPDIHPEDYKYKEYLSHGRMVGYASSSKGQEKLFNYLRENPHRLHLGRVGLVLKKTDGSEASPGDVTGIDQTLDLWSGVIESRFEFEGKPVRVRTCCHPELDMLAVEIESPLIKKGGVAVRFAFPYASTKVDMADWDSPEKHETTCKVEGRRAELARSLDQDHYDVSVEWEGADSEFKQTGKHACVLSGKGERLAFCALFTRRPSSVGLPPVAEAMAASGRHWEEFWTNGGAVDLSGSVDSRAAELERRIVLSQYNVAVNCAGDMPPQETGLLFNSWYGKSHLEMHWWHGVHFGAWGRLPLLERSLGWYKKIMHVGRETAVRQGYEGVRWPKMVGPEGRDSPSPVATLLIWQQPHPIYYAELCYQRHPSLQTLEAWKDVVFESARFMTSFAAAENGRYVLGPPLKTVSENTPQTTTMDPTFELAYWRFGLRVAQAWRKRLGMGEEPKWAEVLRKLAPLPVQDGRYLMQEGMTDTYTKWNWEHPALLGAYGMQPGDGVDVATMRRTVESVMKVWQWDRCWGWDFPMTAMAAARVGEWNRAFEALLIETPKNHYHPNGHVYQRPNLTAYLPANGGLLSAVAGMAVGWNEKGGKGVRVKRSAKWEIRSEGLQSLL